MAGSSFINQTFTYEGEVAADWYSKWLLQPATVKRIKVHPGVKSKFNVPSINATGSLQAEGCDFSASGNITAGTRQLVVTTVDVKKEICEKDLEPLFLSQAMKKGGLNAEFLPADFADMMLTAEGSNIMNEIEQTIWKGDTAGATGTFLDLVDGFIKKMAADVTIISQAGTTITAANVIAEINKVINKIPAAVYQRVNEPTFGIFVPISVIRLYREALSANSPVHFYNMPADQDPTCNGVKLFMTPGMPDNTMVAADANNLWFGTDLLSDMENIEVLPMKGTTGDKKIRILASMKFGVQYGTSTEIVLYKV